MTDIERAIKNIKNRNFCGMCTTATTKELNSCAECENYQAKKLALEALQEKRERRWIPVSERLPEPGLINPNTRDWQQYMCLCEFLGVRDARAISYSDTGRWVNGGINFTQYVLAWQPLPEPWEGEPAI